MEKDAKELLKKYTAGTCTEAEKAMVESWYLQWGGDKPNLSQEKRAEVKEEVWQQLSRSDATRRWPLFRLSYLAIAAAAVMLFALVGGILFLYQDTSSNSKPRVLGLTPAQEEVRPGGNKALLTLADGTTVALDDGFSGEILKTAGLIVRKTADGQLIYEIDPDEINPSLTNGSPRYNRIFTPRGGQYQIILPDQTKVWLNSASSLKYPMQFTDKERRVELTGEAYFEVNSQETESGRKIPFLVETGEQTIEVLGTHFNVNSYADEGPIKTTLLEGSVRVFINGTDERNQLGEANRGVLLKPNQQAVFKDGAWDVVNTSSDESIAWKEGYFSFYEADLASVMRQLARWYDVDVIYESTIPKGTYSGKVYRNMDLTKVLDILTYAEVKFKIVGKTIIISP